MRSDLHGLTSPVLECIMSAWVLTAASGINWELVLHVAPTVDDITSFITINKEYTILPTAEGPYKVMQDLYHQQ